MHPHRHALGVLQVWNQVPAFERTASWDANLQAGCDEGLDPFVILPQTHRRINEPSLLQLHSPVRVLSFPGPASPAADTPSLRQNLHEQNTAAMTAQSKDVHQALTSNILQSNMPHMPCGILPLLEEANLAKAQKERHPMFCMLPFTAQATGSARCTVWQGMYNGLLLGMTSKGSCLARQTRRTRSAAMS